jgi:hypothetical protein
VKEQLTKTAYVLSKNVRVIVLTGLENTVKEIQRDLSKISGRNSSARNMEIPKISVGVTLDCVSVRATTDVTFNTRGRGTNIPQIWASPQNSRRRRVTLHRGTSIRRIHKYVFSGTVHD